MPDPTDQQVIQFCSGYGITVAITTDPKFYGPDPSVSPHWLATLDGVPINDPRYTDGRGATAAQAVLDLMPLRHVTFAPKTLTKADLTYLGAWRFPLGIFGASEWSYGGTAPSINPANNSMFAAGSVPGDRTRNVGGGCVGEIAIPALVNSPNISDLKTAKQVQNFIEPTEGKFTKCSALQTQIMGTLVVGEHLLVNHAVFYDASYATLQKLSMFTRDKNLSIRGTVQGPFGIGASAAGFTSGWLAHAPDSLGVGAPCLAGNGCLSIIGRTSFGPAAFAFDPFSTPVNNVIAAKELVYYQDKEKQCGAWWHPENYDFKSTANPKSPYNVWNPFFTGCTQIKGLVCPDETDSALFFGRHGQTYGYGLGGIAPPVGFDPAKEKWVYDPTNPAKGEHGFPYDQYVWNFKGSDLRDVQAGKKKPWECIPEVFSLADQLPKWADQKALGGACYDRINQIIYATVLQADAPTHDARLPVGVAFKVNIK